MGVIKDLDPHTQHLERRVKALNGKIQLQDEMILGLAKRIQTLEEIIRFRKMEGQA